MNDALPCGKLVDNPVNKSVKKLCLKIVEFYKLWNFELWNFEFLTKFSTLGWKCTNNVNKFYTQKSWLAKLLNMSFPRFPHTSIITITTFN